MSPKRRILLTLLAALAAGCPSRPRAPVPELGPALARCPVELTEAVLADPQSYLACPLPGPVARLVRTDFADDELALPDFQELKRFDGRVPRAAFAHQLEQFIVPDGSLGPWMEFDPVAGLLRPDPILAPDLVVALPADPLPVKLAPQTLLPPLDAEQPFRRERQEALRATIDAAHPVGALRVLIDPGHCGGALAAFESRELRTTGPDGHAFVIREGDLTLKTALELKRKLEQQGIEVALTRDGPGPGHPFPLASFLPYADRLLRHLAQDPAFGEIDRRLTMEERRRLHTAIALYAIKKQFTFEVLRYRMQAAAAWSPDLMISIHYNASAGPPGRSTPQALVAMVRGDYESQRLYNPYYRFRALRDALEVDEFNASAHLGAKCLRHASQLLDIPIVHTNGYPDHRPILRTSGEMSGVDSWNGVLFRYTDWPSVLVEGPHMDERDEMPRLEAAQASVLHQPGTRTERYAEGIARGIVEWASQWLAQQRNDFGPDL